MRAATKCSGMGGIASPPRHGGGSANLERLSTGLYGALAPRGGRDEPRAILLNQSARKRSLSRTGTRTSFVDYAIGAHRRSPRALRGTDGSLVAGPSERLQPVVRSDVLPAHGNAGAEALDSRSRPWESLRGQSRVPPRRGHEKMAFRLESPRSPAGGGIHFALNYICQPRRRRLPRVDARSEGNRLRPVRMS
ncbi:hypothetical protein MRX96_007405 [Rhipicephalus microplus]